MNPPYGAAARPLKTEVIFFNRCVLCQMAELDLKINIWFVDL